MSVVRAFVGHSFNSEDGATVRAFLEYFDQLASSGIDFAWDHAERAEPTELAEKVLRLLDDKNVFIGICTKKEIVLSEGSIKRALWNPRRLTVPANSIEWKTSDWIIQEIGLARGRGMSLVLLLENGVRRPGGLQGNVEYIYFDRGAPQKSFGKIVEMITAISKTTSSAIIAPRQSAPAPSPAEVAASPESKTEQGDPDWSPKPHWDRFLYEFAFYRFLKLGDDDRANSISEAYLKTDEGRQPHATVSWDAYQEFTRIRLAKGGSIARLSTLAQANPQNARVISYFARVAERYQDFATAALRFSAAADVATESESKLFLMRDSALNYLRADDPKSAANVVERMKGIAKDDDIAEVALHRSILEVFQHEKKVNLILGVQERLVQLEPEDIETRYSLAHRYAESGNHGLSLMHYLRIPSSERTAGAWNNIGVAFAHCSFPIKSTDAYRTAEKMGATLAMSNLANNMLNAGFLAEAKAICIRAQTIPDHDKNVDVALARTFDEVAEEDKTLDENLKESAPQSTYYSAFGHALSRPAITSIKRFWKHPKCRLEVTISGDQFIAIGSYKEPVTHGLLGLTMIGPLGGFATAPNESDVSVEYRGTINGHAVEGSASRKKSGQLAYSSLATSGMEGETTLLVINEQQTEIWIMEMSISKTPTFLKIFVETPE